MRILFYIPDCSGGGAEKIRILLANYFANIGFHVCLCTDRSRNDYYSMLSDKVDVVFLNCNSHAIAVLLLRRRILKFDPDVIFSSIGLSPLKSFLACFNTKYTSRLVFTYHSLLMNKSTLGSKINFFFTSWMQNYIRAIVAISSDIKSQLIDSGVSPDKIFIIYNPIDMKSHDGMNHYVMPHSKPYILSVGRLCYEKGFFTLVDAFSMIQHKVLHDLLIVGEGPLRDELQCYIDNLNLSTRIHLVGFVQNPYAYYRFASLFISSSYFEGFGNVIVEALSMGLPVIATLCPGGPKEILDMGKYGLLVPVGDENALSNAVIGALSVFYDKERLISRANDFRIESIADIYMNLFFYPSKPEVL